MMMMMMMTIGELCVVVASYLLVAGVSAWAGAKAGADIMRRYWEGKR